MYPGSLGPGALRFGRLLEGAAQRHRVACCIAPPPSELAALARTLRLPVLAQHTDPYAPGAHTGFVVAESLKAVGAQGSLVNHSEHPLAADDLERVVLRLRHEALVPVVCARDVSAVREVAALRPPYIAIEPPELIAGKISVSSARPELVSESVSAARAISPATRVLCGAGIHTARDVERALELGTSGVLVASAVAAADDPGRALDELLRGFRKRAAA